jgi:hypothetical protein
VLIIWCPATPVLAAAALLIHAGPNAHNLQA